MNDLYKLQLGFVEEDYNNAKENNDLRYQIAIAIANLREIDEKDLTDILGILPADYALKILIFADNINSKISSKTSFITRMLAARYYNRFKKHLEAGSVSDITSMSKRNRDKYVALKQRIFTYTEWIMILEHTYNVNELFDAMGEISRYKGKDKTKCALKYLLNVYNSEKNYKMREQIINENIDNMLHTILTLIQGLDDKVDNRLNTPDTP